MTPLDDPDDPCASPCIGDCTIQPASGLCVGCARTMQEIMAWPSLGTDRKREILAQLETRRQG